MRERKERQAKKNKSSSDKINVKKAVRFALPDSNQHPQKKLKETPSQDAVKLNKINQASKIACRQLMANNDTIMEQLVGIQRPRLIKYFRRHVKDLCIAPEVSDDPNQKTYEEILSKFSKFWQGVCATYPDDNTADRIHIVIDNTLELIINIRTFRFDTQPSLAYEPLNAQDVICYKKDEPVKMGERHFSFGGSTYIFRSSNPNSSKPLWHLKTDINSSQHFLCNAFWEESPYAKSTFDKMYDLLQQDNQMLLLLDLNKHKDHEIAKPTLPSVEQHICRHDFIKRHRGKEFALLFQMVENESSLEPVSKKKLFDELQHIYNSSDPKKALYLMHQNYQFWKGALCAVEQDDKSFKKNLHNLYQGLINLQASIIQRHKQATSDTKILGMKGGY